MHAWAQCSPVFFLASHVTLELRLWPVSHSLDLGEICASHRSLNCHNASSCRISAEAQIVSARLSSLSVMSFKILYYLKVTQRTHSYVC